eukprot:1146276-Pelagomonas_calceolata.AAC.4
MAIYTELHDAGVSLSTSKQGLPLCTNLLGIKLKDKKRGSEELCAFQQIAAVAASNHELPTALEDGTTLFCAHASSVQARKFRPAMKVKQLKILSQELEHSSPPRPLGEVLQSTLEGATKSVINKSELLCRPYLK